MRRESKEEEATGASGQKRRCSESPSWSSAAASHVPLSTKGASKARRDQINAEIRNLKERCCRLAEADKVRLSYLHIMSLACIYTRKGVFFAGGVEQTAETELGSLREKKFEGPAGTAAGLGKRVC